MGDFLRYVVVFGLAGVLALLLTPPVRWLAVRVGMVDKPDPRRIHTQPTPRGGGVAVFIAFHVALYAMSLLDLGVEVSRLGPHWRSFFLLASGSLMVVGLLDDAFGLKPWLKLAGQIVVASLMFGSGARIGDLLWFSMPEGFDYPLTLVWYIVLINAFNLIDGMDGLAAGLALIASVGLAGSLFTRHLVAEALPLVALAGACLGFLRYNFHPASVFLGDCGSMFLGLVLATIPLLTSAKSEFLASLGIPLLAMGVPLFDTLLAIWRRSVRAALPEIAQDGVRRIRLMQADREHLHHRILARGLNQRHAAFVLYGLGFVLVAVGLSGLIFRARSTGILLLGFLAVAYIVVRHLSRVELWDTGRALLSTIRAPLSARLAVPIYVALDLVWLALAWVTSRHLLAMPISQTDAVKQLPLVAAPVFLMLALMRTYRRVWSRARLRDHALLMAAILSGSVIATALAFLFGVYHEGFVRVIVVFALVASFPIVGQRLAAELIAEGMSGLERQRLLERKDIERILVYGGGRRFQIFIRERRATVGRNERAIVGIVDDDINLRGRFVEGYPVLGELEGLSDLVRAHGIHTVVITAQVSGDKLLTLAAAARAAAVRLTQWDYAEHEVVSGPPPPAPA